MVIFDAFLRPDVEFFRIFLTICAICTGVEKFIAILCILLLGFSSQIVARAINPDKGSNCNLPQCEKLDRMEQKGGDQQTFLGFLRELWRMLSKFNLPPNAVDCYIDEKVTKGA